MPKIMETLLLFEDDFSNISFEYVTTFFSAMTGMLSLWYRQGKQISTEEFFKIMQSLIVNGSFVVIFYLNYSVFFDLFSSAGFE